jgi:hypothetical protein
MLHSTYELWLSVVFGQQRFSRMENEQTNVMIGYREPSGRRGRHRVHDFCQGNPAFVYDLLGCTSCCCDAIDSGV